MMTATKKKLIKYHVGNEELQYAMNMARYHRKRSDDWSVVVEMIKKRVKKQKKGLTSMKNSVNIKKTLKKGVKNEV